MLRERKASTAEEGSFSSFTGGELFRLCLALLADLKLLGWKEPQDPPQRGPGRRHSLEGWAEVEKPEESRKTMGGRGERGCQKGGGRGN